jgi:GT2 family glycosyltransferase
MADYVEGACMLARREAYAAAGGLDEAYYMYAEDVELCYALKQAGWQVCYQPAAKVIHIGGASSRNRRPERESDLYCSRVRFFRRHYGSLAANILMAQIFSFTVSKVFAHRLVRFLSHGRYGRTVVPLRQLATGLRRV